MCSEILTGATKRIRGDCHKWSLTYWFYIYFFFPQLGVRKCARLVEFAPLTFFRRAYIADGRESGEATKKSPEGLFLSRSHSVDISWEHGAFFDVGDAEEAGSDALQADGEAAVRGHAVFRAPLCASLAPQARIPRTPHGYSAPRPHPLLRGIFSHSQLRLSRPTE